MASWRRDLGCTVVLLMRVGMGCAGAAAPQPTRGPCWRAGPPGGRFV